MAFCEKCGAEIPAGSQFCPKCGAPADGNVVAQEGASVGQKILAVLFPIVGWILYFVYKKDQPKKASECALFGWIGFAIGLVFTIISNA